VDVDVSLCVCKVLQIPCVVVLAGCCGGSSVVSSGVKVGSAS